MKNEHFVWGYGELPHEPGKMVLFIGLTDAGVAYLQAGSGTDKKTLLADFPSTLQVKQVTQVILFHEKTKDELKAVIAKAVGAISEIH